LKREKNQPSERFRGHARSQPAPAPTDRRDDLDADPANPEVAQSRRHQRR